MIGNTLLSIMTRIASWHQLGIWCYPDLATGWRRALRHRWQVVNHVDYCWNIIR